MRFTNSHTAGVILLLLLYVSSQKSSLAQPSVKHNLLFEQIPASWDEGIPLGNGMQGALVWQKEGKLRISLDRADLWDLRPTREIEKYTYQWAYEHRVSGDWDTVGKVGDEPYDRDAAPTKIPGAAIEFDISKLGTVKHITLDIASAICTILWENGASFRICVDAAGNCGRYHWQNTVAEPELIAPAYTSVSSAAKGNEVVDGQDLRRLGYEAGSLFRKGKLIIYNQSCWGPLKYQAAVAWKSRNGSCEGAFSISSHYSDKPKAEPAGSIVKKAIRTGFSKGVEMHKRWWKQYWAKSSVNLPDPQLEKQWYLEMYKFGSASR